MASQSAGMSHITVCVCTYKRPQLLRVLLENLEQQDTAELFTYSISVTDNDSGQSARECVEHYRAQSGLELRYSVELEQNIAQARNRSVQEARGDYVAFIDDDEFPARNWLLMLYRCIHAENAFGVLGPVQPCYCTETPEWVRRGKFYEKQPPYRTGQVLHWTDTRTSNALVRRQLFRNPGNLFRAEFGSGGEDRDFFRRMIDRGCTFVWCNEAMVFEAVPPERCARSFMLRRALLRGRVSISSAAFTTGDILRSCLAAVAYTVALPVFSLRQHVFMKYLIKDFEHIGRLLALCGVTVVKQKYVME